MNNFTAVTLINWETRNWRHHAKAVLWCRDYGLKQITRTLFIGKLYGKERAALSVKFREIFGKKTEKFVLVTLCQSCFEIAFISDTIKANTAETASFELVQFSENRSKNQ